MTKRRQISAEQAGPPEGYVKADQIDLDSWYDFTIAISDRGEPYAYLGFVPPDSDLRDTFFHLSVAKRYKTPITEYRFARLYRGTIILDSFLSSWGFFRVLDDKSLTLPSGANGYFGVTARGAYEEDVGLTGQLFGATLHDLQRMLEIYSRVAHH